MAKVTEQCLPGPEAMAENKTALAPPAERAPVFPHAFPVTEGLKTSALLRVAEGVAALLMAWAKVSLTQG